MNFKEYLIKTQKIANEEKEILDILSQKDTLSPIELRAAKNSLQVIIENTIGKLKRVLKYYNCPIIPQRSKDALIFLYDAGAIEDELYQSLNSAIGFRNSMIHDYMKFNEEILYKILKEKKYLDIYYFLIDDIEYSEVIIKRIESYSL